MIRGSARKVKWYFALALSLLLVSAKVAGASQVALGDPIADSMVNSFKSTWNYGASENMCILPRDVSNSRIFLNFSTGAIPAGVTVKTAILKLFMVEAPSTSFGVNAHRLTAAWDEGAGQAGNTICPTAGAGTTTDVSWDERQTNVTWTSAGGDFNATATNSSPVSLGTTSGVTISIEVTSAVRDWFSGAQSNFGIIVKESAIVGNFRSRFRSREDPTASQRPNIDVTYAPPAATDLTATAGNGQVTFFWTPKPSSFSVPAGDTHGVVIFRTGCAGNCTPPAITDPSDLTAPAVGVSSSNCTAGQLTQCIARHADGSATSFLDTTASNGNTYAYKAFGYLCRTSTGCGGSPDHGYAVTDAPSVTATPTDTTVASNPRWVYNTVTATLAAPSLIPNADLSLSSVFFANNNGRVFGVRGSDGTERFRPFIVSDAIQGRSPVGTLSGDSDRTLFAGSLNGDAYALWAGGASGGTQRWSTVAIDGNSGIGGDQPLGDDIQAAPVVSPSANRVFIATRNLSGSENRIFAVNAATGACVWVFNGTCAGATTALQVGQISQQPIHDATNRRLFVTSTKLGTGSTVWAIDTNDTATCTNRICWQRDLGASDASPAFGNFALSSLYVGTNSGRVYKLNPTDGANLWADFFCTDNTVDALRTEAQGCASGSAIKIGFFMIGSGTYANNIVFSTADGNVRMVNSAGTLVWKTATAITGAGFPLVLPDVGGGKVYVGGNDGLIRQLILGTGVQDATSNVGGGTVVVGDPAYDNLGGRLYVGTSQGKLYALTVPF